MADTPDLDSLRAVMAQRTPGEWAVDNFNGEIHDGNGFRIAILAKRDDCAAIVAAVNSCGPLLERVEKLEERRKSALARYGKSLADNANMEATFEREATIANKNIQALEAENKRLLERVRELERQVLSLRVGSAACDQAADDDAEVIDKLEIENAMLIERRDELLSHAHEIESENGSLLRQLAAANERIAELEAASGGSGAVVAGVRRYRDR